MWYKSTKHLKKLTKEDEESFKENIDKTGLEKNDKFAMIIAAVIVFIPAALLVMLFLYLVMRLFFRI